MKDIDKEVFDFAYMMAFRDATIRNAFIKKSDEENLARTKAEIKGRVRDIVKSYIDGIFNGETDDKSCEKTIKAVVDKAGDPRFNFGNAQKLVNMTAKYMYISVYGNKDLREKFKYCHCPIDRTIITEVRNNEEVQFSEADFSWSALKLENEEDIEKYNNLQESIRGYCEHNECYAIDFDYLYF